jgi:hypothetical protein
MSIQVLISKVKNSCNQQHCLVSIPFCGLQVFENLLLGVVKNIKDIWLVKVPSHDHFIRSLKIGKQIALIFQKFTFLSHQLTRNPSTFRIFVKTATNLRVWCHSKDARCSLLPIWKQITFIEAVNHNQLCVACLMTLSTASWLICGVVVYLKADFSPSYLLKWATLS